MYDVMKYKMQASLNCSLDDGKGLAAPGMDSDNNIACTSSWIMSKFYILKDMIDPYISARWCSAVTVCQAQRVENEYQSSDLLHIARDTHIWLINTVTEEIFEYG